MLKEVDNNPRTHGRYLTDELGWFEQKLASEAKAQDNGDHSNGMFAAFPASNLGRQRFKAA